MAKRLLYLEDLHDFYSSKYKRSTHYSSAKSGEPIVVHVRGRVNFAKDDGHADGLLGVHLQACHTEENLNGSNIAENVMTNALSSFSNRPILGYIHEVNGQPEFYGHNMHEDEDGNLIYDEVPIGIIPESCNAQLVYDKEKKHTYVEVDGYIFEEYSRAAEIMEREEECNVSVELSIRELSYNAKKKFLDIEDFYFSGVTILGVNDNGDKVMPGMAGSNIKLADFSADNNSLFSANSDLVVEMNEKLNKLLSHFDIDDNDGKEEPEVEEEIKVNEEVTEEVTETEESAEEVTEEVADETTETETDETEDTPEVVEENEEGEAVAEEEFSAEEPAKFVKSFEISHDEIRYALYNLLAPFEEADNDWYFINAVYDDHFTYENWMGDKIYGQTYAKDGDNVAFEGERYALHRELLTDAEFAELQSMRANYSALVEFKEKADCAELNAQKMSVLEAEKFSGMYNDRDAEGNFNCKELGTLIDNIANYSLAEFEKEAKVILADYLTNGGKFSITTKEDKPVAKKFFGDVTEPKKKSRYGNLFSK